MKRFITALGLLACLIFSATGCNKAKALRTVRQADELSAKLLIYGRNIAKANNDSFAAGNIPAQVHLKTNDGAAVYLKGVDIFLAAVVTAKKAVAAGSNAAGQVNILKAVFEQEVVNAALALVSLVATLPPGLGDRIGGWAAAIQLAIASFRGLFAQFENSLNQEATYA